MFGWVQWFLPLKARLTTASIQVSLAAQGPNHASTIPHQAVRQPRYLAYGDQRYRYAHHTANAACPSPRIDDR
ncbi:uncharacterized protein M421DRAFT_209748 [Didymella exigua CBS 183.55]|uniref:Secreted protein n=1 Tax=Didymella exigua CBS 183.55 TaxID=1150837 RepID=A0A6A5RJG2_9PLEO|nr:uncharacterized protein M421DRAFT_209748 [Didymella exigua CBS 183.55]KAF1926556.1 hypothetical protein M421DRAFT_209748 [Didymella exigua CBS 183.55]